MPAPENGRPQAAVYPGMGRGDFRCRRRRWHNGGVLRRPHAALLACLLALPCLTAHGQSTLQRLPPPPDPTLTYTEIHTEIVVLPLEISGGWLELTPLASDERPASLMLLGHRRSEDGERRLKPEGVAGPAMLCTGGRPWAVRCEEIYLERELTTEVGAGPWEVEAQFAAGVEVVGRYRLDRWPVAGARVAVVPAELEAARPFTMPLGRRLRGLRPGVRSGAMVREVLTDGDGRFALPALAAGRYFLETILPSGRVHRSDPFDLPGVAAVRAQAAASDEDRVTWDLGVIDVADGPVVEVQVRDPEGSPVPGARVACRQGDGPRELRSFEAAADRHGDARLSGFLIERPVHLSCRAPGYTVFEREFELLPAVVLCTLEPLGLVTGEVLGIEGLGVPGAAVSVVPIAEPSGEAVVGSVDGAGRFIVGELAPGEYALTAAAPGREVAEQTFTLVAGERLDLGAIVLLRGRELPGRVIDADNEEPIAGAEIRALDPPGAVWARSDDRGEFTLASRTDRPLVLEAAAEDYAPAEVVVEPARLFEEAPLVIELVRAGWIRAVVWDEAADLPCQGCPLVVQPSAEELRTDAWGEAVSGPLARGYYRVYRPRVTHLGSTVLEQRDAEMRYVRVEPGRIATVRFGESRRPLRVVFWPASEPGWSLSVRTPWRTERVSREADGSFRVRHRRGESAELFLQLWDPVAGAEVAVRQATLPADLELKELVLPRRSAVLAGRATTGGGPIAGERVRLRSVDGAEQAEVRSRADGRFRIPHLPPGVYAVMIGDRVVRFVSLYDGQTLDLGTFELIAGGY